MSFFKMDASRRACFRLECCTQADSHREQENVYAEKMLTKSTQAKIVCVPLFHPRKGRMNLALRVTPHSSSNHSINPPYIARWELLAHKTFGRDPARQAYQSPAQRYRILQAPSSILSIRPSLCRRQ